MRRFRKEDEMRNGGEAKSLVDDAFREVARQAVRGVIADEVGSGIDSEVKSAIKEMASEMVQSDPEIKKLIRDRLIYWIARA